MSVTLLI